SKLRFFYIQAKQTGNFFMVVAFNIVKEKNHFFGCRQFHHGALQMHPLHIAGHPKSQRINSVAMLTVNRIIVSASGAVFSCGKNSKITDNAHAARHLTYLFFSAHLQVPFDYSQSLDSITTAIEMPKERTLPSSFAI